MNQISIQQGAAIVFVLGADGATMEMTVVAGEDCPAVISDVVVAASDAISTAINMMAASRRDVL